MPQEPSELSEYSERPSRKRSYNQEEIDLRELIKVLWQSKNLIIGATLICVAISVITALWLPNIYRSETLLATDTESGGSLAGLASQYAGLASLAGVSLPTTDGSNDVQVGIAILQSREFISEFVERHNILPEVMAAKSFDWNTGTLSYKRRIYDFEAGNWTRKEKPPFEAKPSLQEAYDEFRDILSVSEDSDNGFISVSIEHPSPIIAREWVSWLIADLNQKMMLEATEEARQSIDYLSDQLKNTRIVALEEVFYSLIEEQTKTMMLANSRPEYLFRTIDPPVAPQEPSRPYRLLIVVLGALLGGILGATFIFLRYHFKLT